MAHKDGDIVFWATTSAAGEYTVIGHPNGDKAGKVLVQAHSGEISVEIDADECSPQLVAATRSAAESIAGDISATVMGAGGQPLGPSCNNRLSSLLVASYD